MALYVCHIFCHDRANGRAGGKEKIGHINFVLVMVLGNGISVLVDQLKIGYAVVFFNI